MVAPSSKKSSKGGKAAAKDQTFTIDFSGPAADSVFDGDAFEKFLVDRIKVDGKTGQLGENVRVSKQGKDQIAVTSSIPFSKRYLKYLTKKFLKKNLMREWLRVISTSPTTYTLKFYNVSMDEEAAADA